MSFDASAIPQELRERPQWVIWRFEPNPKKPDGKPLKVPYYANHGKRWGDQGTDKDRAKLVPLDAALAAREKRSYDGVGFAFLPGDGLIGIDIDKCIDDDTGEIAPMAEGIINECLSYTEYSPSRRGVHIIVAGVTETFKSDRIGLEVFCGSQFFTFTGQPYAGMPLTVMPIAEAALDRMRGLVMKARAAGRSSASSAPAAGAPPNRTPFEERARVMSALAAIPPSDYHEWIKVGMALYNTFGAEGFSIWDSWSRDSKKYGGSGDLEPHWESFKSGVSVTVGAIFGLAKDYGWKAPRPVRPTAPQPVPRSESPPPPTEEPPLPDEIPVSVGAEGDPPAGSPPLPTRGKPDLRVVGGSDQPGEEPTGNAAGVGGEADGGGGGGRKKKPEKKRPQSFWDTVDRLRQNFVLLYGTNTAWDRDNRMQIKITDLRYAYGGDAVKYWLADENRQMINHDRLVFDPTRTCDEATHVNLFHGFEVEPKKGECHLIIDLLAHLCDNDQDLLTWILRWIAYPLRNVGAKMPTSIIMHGDEGSGKNLFWERVVRRIYGEYGGVIGNAQIESQFNEWASKKLFSVCDEVVTRNELKQLKGKLKHMISGDDIRINPKNLPERAEANHINFVFLSNELQPLALDKTDRRYLVVWTPPKRDADYYKAVAAQADAGGVEAFYHYLLHELDMGDFTEHTKPLDTAAKKKLISLGLEAPERFYREWSNQMLPLPFISCSAMQLYAGFQRWCHLNGERFPPSQTIFGAKVERHAAGEVKRRMVKYGLGSVVKQRTVYLVSEPPDGTTLTDFVEAASDQFETYLKKYRHVYDQSEDSK